MPVMPSLPFQTVLGSALLAATVILSQAEPAPATLKDAYKDYFKIGTAINRSVATGRSGRRSEAQVAADVALVKAQFNHVVAENEMKWSSLHPRAGKDGYDWQAADDFVEFGTKNQMELAGHTLVWHSQVPHWVFEGTQLPAGASAEPRKDDATEAPNRPRHLRALRPPQAAVPEVVPVDSEVSGRSIWTDRGLPVTSCWTG